MNNLLLALFLALAPLSFVAGTTGCTTSQKTVAYKTLGAIATTVDALLKPYADLVVSGKVDAPTQVRIGDLKTKYSAAFKAAVTVARGDLTKLASEDVQNLANTLTEALTVILKKGGHNDLANAHSLNRTIRTRLGLRIVANHPDAPGTDSGSLG